MPLQKYLVTIPHPSRDHSDEGQVIDSSIANLWKNEHQHLAVVAREVRGQELRFRTDWTSLVACHLELERMSAVLRTNNDALKAAVEHYTQLLPISVEVEVEGGRSIPADVAHYLQDLFLMANLAVPGSFNLRGAFLLERTDSAYRVDLDLDSSLFENAWISSLRGSLPGVKSFSLSLVADWLRRTTLANVSIALSGTQRALFCLLHLSREWDFDPVALLWISHGLEALFAVPNAMSFNFLRSRLQLLHKFAEPDAGKLGRDLRKFMDARNAFAHGGMRIVRPNSFDVSPEADQFCDDMMRLRDSGFRILLGSLQRLIESDVSELRFREVLQEEAE